MERLAKFIGSEKDRLARDTLRIGHLFSSLLDSMSNLPTLFPVYIDKIVTEIDFNSKIDFYSNDAYVPKLLDSEQKERRHYLSYLGKHIDFARGKILPDIERDRAIPSQIGKSIVIQEEIVTFYNQFYESHKNSDVLRKLPQNTPKIVCKEITIPFFKNIHHLLAMKYCLAVKTQGTKWNAITNEQKKNVLLESRLAYDIPYVNAFMSNDLDNLYAEYISLYKTKNETTSIPVAETIKKREPSKHKDLVKILSNMESVIGGVQERALLRSRGKAVSFKHQTAKGRDYLLSQHLAEIAKVRKEADQNNLDRNALINILRRSNSLLSGVWMGENNPILDSDISKRLLELDRILGKIYIK